jgi:hypothetical protein
MSTTFRSSPFAKAPDQDGAIVLSGALLGRRIAHMNCLGSWTAQRPPR